MLRRMLHRACRRRAARRAPALAQQPPHAGQDGFVPVELSCRRASSCRPRRSLIGSYAFFLVLMMFYLWTIWRRIGKVEQEMQRLERRHREPRSGDRRSLHLHPVGPAGRRRDRLDSRLARRARRVRDGAEAARGRQRAQARAAASASRLSRTQRPRQRELASQRQPARERLGQSRLHHLLLRDLERRTAAGSDRPAASSASKIA